MSNYRKKPVVIQAHQWFKNGDHPDDGNETFMDGEYAGEKYEGLVVRYFRRPDVPGTQQCSACGETLHVHGWIDTLEGGRIVCPGDWIITGVAGERYPCKPHIFTATYEPEPVPAAVPDDVARDAARDAAVGAAINRAAGELPAGYDVHIEVEKGACTVKLYGPGYGEMELDFDGDTLAGEINTAIDAAMAASQKEE